MNETFWFGHAPIVARQRVTWSAEVVLEQSLVATIDAPPRLSVTSARAVVLSGNSILVLKDRDGTRHVVPGGRIEPGESWIDTIHREVREETGLCIRVSHQLAVIVSTHQLPRPSNYRYPYPTFNQVVYLAHVCDSTQLHIDDEWVSFGGFIPVSDAQALHLPPIQTALITLVAEML